MKKEMKPQSKRSNLNEQINTEKFCGKWKKKVN